MIAAIDEELVPRHGGDRNPRDQIKIEHRQGAARLDAKLAVGDGDLQIGRRRADQRARVPGVPAGGDGVDQVSGIGNRKSELRL